MSIVHLSLDFSLTFRKEWRQIYKIILARKILKSQPTFCKITYKITSSNCCYQWLSSIELAKNFSIWCHLLLTSISIIGLLPHELCFSSSFSYLYSHFSVHSEYQRYHIVLIRIFEYPLTVNSNFIYFSCSFIWKHDRIFYLSLLLYNEQI